MSNKSNVTVRAWSELPLSLDLATVAAIFDVTEKTIRNWKDEGLLDACAIGGTIRFERDYIHDVLRHGPLNEKRGDDRG